MASFPVGRPASVPMRLDYGGGHQEAVVPCGGEMDVVERYMARFGFCGRQVAEAPAPGLGLVVVVPCHAEPDLVSGLEALWRCRRPRAAVEVILVINAAVTAGPEVRALHASTVAVAESWIRDHEESGFRVHLLRFEELPPRQAGVGLARKIGMDEGLRRLAMVNRLERGVLVGFDADCGCAPDYLCRVEEMFEEEAGCPGASIYFEHPLAGELDRAVYEAGGRYELHLRYYVEALRWAGFPFAFQTIGSSMAVRASVYMAQGGMNKRQAGEDFYFLHKVIPLGGYRDLVETVVYPSPRPSLRVPFGTGRAVRNQLGGQAQLTYPLEAFGDLRGWLEGMDEERLGEWRTSAPPSLASFLEKQGFAAAWEEIRANTRDWGSRQRRWWRWFDGFRVMKYVHHARDGYYGAQPVEEAAERFLGECLAEAGGAGTLLDRFRVLARRKRL